MTPKEKSIELVDKMYATQGQEYGITFYEAKDCALIAINLHLEELSKMKLIFSDRELHYKYWQEVKQEIEKL